MNDFLTFAQTLWPIFAAIIGAIVWLILQLNKKMDKTDCKDCRQECEKRQNIAFTRVENTLIDMRHEFCGRLDNITSIVVKLGQDKKKE